MTEAENNNNGDWKDRFQEIVQSAHSEFKKATQIGKKMISATQVNQELHEKYEELGHLVLNAVKSGELKWDDKSVLKIIENIDELESKLEHHEDAVTKIKQE